MLLQLVEPGSTPSPHDQEPSVAVGIDLGTTHSLIAYVQDGQPIILKEEHERSGIVCSAVYYGAHSQPVVGNAALIQLQYDPLNVIVSVKKSMGMGAEGGEHAEQITRFTTAQGSKTPVEVSADILRTLKNKAEKILGKTVEQAVITVPAYFDDAARTATRDAAQLAGLTVLRLLNEPTAAALAYGLEKNVEGYYAVYDLGGGTFDFSLLRLEKGIFQVLATGGNTHLGGDDFDAVLVGIINKQFSCTSTLINQDDKQLLHLARCIKERLSQEKEFSEILSVQGQTVAVHFSAANYQEAIRPLIDQTLVICQQVLRDAGIKKEALNGIVLVGGSTRTPAVIDNVRGFFKQEPLRDIHPDEAVALGAALQAHALTQGSSNLLLDVNPLSLGIETMGGLVEKIVPRNSPIPLAKTQEFTTFEDGQTALLIHVVQGERELVKDCRSLARFELRGIPPMNAGSARIRVTFAIDADSILTVSAMEKITGIIQHIEVKPTYGLAPSELHEMLLASFNHAEEDVALRQLMEAKVSSKRLITALKSALNQDQDLLSPQEYQEIKNILDHLQMVQSDSDYTVIKQAEKKLEQVSQHFAEKRIERAIKQTLKGRSIEDMERNIG